MKLTYLKINILSNIHKTVILLLCLILIFSIIPTNSSTKFSGVGDRRYLPNTNLLSNKSNQIQESISASEILELPLNNLSRAFAPNYTASIYLELDQLIVDVNMTIELFNPTGKIMSNFFLHHWLLSYTQGNVATFFEGIETLDMNYTKILVNNQLTNYNTTSSTIELLGLNIGVDLKFVVEIQFSTTLPQLGNRFGWTNLLDGSEAHVLAHLLPSIPYYRNNNWVLHSWASALEPYYSEYASYNVSINTPKEYIGYGAGKMINQVIQPNNRTISEYFAFPIWDWTYIGGYNFQLDEQSITLRSGNIVNIHSLHLTSTESTSSQMVNAGEMIQFFSDRFSDYPYDDFVVAEYSNQWIGANLEYPQLILMYAPTNDLEKQYFDSILAHEVAHQWGPMMINFEQPKEPFMDEGLTTYMQRLWTFENDQVVSLNMRQGMETNFQLFNLHQIMPMNKSTYVESSYWEFYTGAAWMIESLEYTIGSEKFYQALKQFFRSNRFTSVSGINFSKQLSEILKMSFVESYLLYFWNMKKLPIYEVDAFSSHNSTHTTYTIKFESQFNIPQRIEILFNIGTISYIPSYVDTFILNGNSTYVRAFPTTGSTFMQLNKNLKTLAEFSEVGLVYVTTKTIEIPSTKSTTTYGTISSTSDTILSSDLPVSSKSEALFPIFSMVGIVLIYLRKFRSVKLIS